MSLTAADYLARVRPEDLFPRLRVPDPATFARNVAHFTEKEGEGRDAILLDYIGESGIERVTGAIVEALLPAGAMKPDPAILDIGAGSGLFTQRVAEGLRARGLRPRMFAMDATPAMLRVLAGKPVRAVPFLGALEDLEGSVREAAKVQPVPELFDGAFSTLALHHCTDLPRFFEGAARILAHGAPFAIMDMVEHGHESFREELGDVHLGFPPEQIEALALDRFHTAEARVLEGVCCTSADRPIGLFVATLSR